MNKDKELRAAADDALERWDVTRTDAWATIAFSHLAELAGYRIDWIAEPVRLVRL